MPMEERNERAEEPSSTGNGTVKFSITKRKRVVQKTISAQAEEESTSDIQFLSSVEEIIQGPRDATAPKLLIPKLEDTWKPEKRMKNLITAPEDIFNNNAQEFISEVVPAGPVEGVQYGLSVRPSATSKRTGNGSVTRDMIEARELRAKMDKQALDEHLDFLPESASLDAYEAMPVENFGEALLLGMGWKTGAGVGRRASEDVKVFEFVRRPEGLGLGAVPQARREDNTRRRIRPGETREARPDLVAAPGQDGRVRHRVEVGEKLVERQKKGVYGGKVMSIISGRHAGLKGEVVWRKDKAAVAGDVVQVKLVRSGQTVQVDAKDLADVGSLEEEKALKKLKELRISQSNQAGDDRGKARPWLASQIRVRIVSKRFKDGKLYLKKGRVIDVIAPTVCNILVDESGELLENVKQDYLETALPRKGGRVLVVGGSYRGSVAKLVEKDSRKESAVVQLEDSLEMVSLDLDHLAEFTGDVA